MNLLNNPDLQDKLKQLKKNQKTYQKTPKVPSSLEALCLDIEHCDRNCFRPSDADSAVRHIERVMAINGISRSQLPTPVLYRLNKLTELAGHVQSPKPYQPVKVTVPEPKQMKDINYSLWDQFWNWMKKSWAR
jgi:hypothetical protein